MDMGKRITRLVDQLAPKFQLMLLLELSDASGRRTSKMVAVEPEIPISQLIFGHIAFELLDPET